MRLVKQLIIIVFIWTVIIAGTGFAAEESTIMLWNAPHEEKEWLESIKGNYLLEEVYKKVLESERLYIERAYSSASRAFQSAVEISSAIQLEELSDNEVRIKEAFEIYSRSFSALCLTLDKSTQPTYALLEKINIDSQQVAPNNYFISDLLRRLANLTYYKVINDIENIENYSNTNTGYQYYVGRIENLNIEESLWRTLLSKHIYINVTEVEKHIENKDFDVASAILDKTIQYLDVYENAGWFEETDQFYIATHFSIHSANAYVQLKLGNELKTVAALDELEKYSEDLKKGSNKIDGMYEDITLPWKDLYYFHVASASFQDEIDHYKSLNALYREAAISDGKEQSLEEQLKLLSDYPMYFSLMINIADNALRIGNLELSYKMVYDTLMYDSTYGIENEYKLNEVVHDLLTNEMLSKGQVQSWIELLVLMDSKIKTKIIDEKDIQREALNNAFELFYAQDYENSEIIFDILHQRLNGDTHLLHKYSTITVKKLLELDPEKAVNFYQYYAIVKMHLNKMESAENIIQEAKAYAYRYPSPKFQEAQALFNKEQYDAAKAIIFEEQSKRPFNNEGLYLFAMSTFFNGDSAGALKKIEDIIPFNKTDQTIRFGTSALLLQSKFDYQGVENIEGSIHNSQGVFFTGKIMIFARYFSVIITFLFLIYLFTKNAFQTIDYQTKMKLTYMKMQNLKASAYVIKRNN